jgi:hypothetical protein
LRTKAGAREKRRKMRGFYSAAFQGQMCEGFISVIDRKQ